LLVRKRVAVLLNQINTLALRVKYQMLVLEWLMLLAWVILFLLGNHTLEQNKESKNYKIKPLRALAESPLLKKRIKPKANYKKLRTYLIKKEVKKINSLRLARHRKN
jgi:hypothetical protein